MTSGTVVGVIVAFLFIGTTFLVLVRVLAECFLQLHTEDLHEVRTFMSLFIRIGLACALIFLDWSAVFVKAMTVTCIVTLALPAVILT